MKYIITGGLGFIGSHLIEKLKGKETINIDNNCSLSENKLDYINADVRDKDIEKYFEEGDIVIHLAAISSLPECQDNPQLAFDNNVNGTVNILEISRKKKIKKIIFASTSAIYENNKIFPCKEEDIVNPTLIYSLTKKHCEDICLSYVKNYDMDISIIRFFNTYGSNQNFVRKSPPLTIYILKELLDNRSPILHSDGEQKRDYVYIEDLTNLILLIVNKDNIKCNIFNACSGDLVSVNEIYKIISTKLDKNIQPKYNQAENFWNKYEFSKDFNKEIIKEEVVKYTLGSNDKSKELLNWKLNYTMELGLEKMIKDFIKKNQ